MIEKGRMYETESNIKKGNTLRAEYNELRIANLESIAAEAGPLRHCCHLPFPSRWTSAVVVPSQLYAAVAFAACQDTLQLASRH
jgi:hypothetical protein